MISRQTHVPRGIGRRSVSAVEMRVPDIGDFKDVPIIELLVKPGDLIALEDPVATLESEKATLDVPASAAGRVLTVVVSPGTRVSKGSLLMTIEPSFAESPVARAPQPAVPPPAVSAERVMPAVRVSIDQDEHLAGTQKTSGTALRVYASPSVRRIGRELGLDMAKLNRSGRGGRLLATDVQEFVRTKMTTQATLLSPAIASLSAGVPAIDFAKYGEVERQSLSRIRKIAGSTLARNWATIPHVTNFDEADITDLERFRESVNGEKGNGTKLTLLSFLVKAGAATLKEMPAFNASLDGDSVVLKKYVHIGAAVDTPAGLLVPVIRNADQLGIRAIAAELATKAATAREGKLKIADMEGGCFTISSLGGIGGTGFTPIINAPELAILGVGKARIQPRWDGAQFMPRSILPLCLSWDHRALDGVAAARFLVLLVRFLEDFRRISL
jgi:pyruvate dehydrogenase E2 component (dihydrolipoyllysine-residue acetyltransferase)